MMSAAIYLSAARQVRLSAVARPDLAATYKARARYWLAMAGVARRKALRTGWRLP
jgi:hypothetical protein